MTKREDDLQSAHPADRVIMAEQITVGDISVDVLRKKIKNLHLRVYPPTERVRISAPDYLDLEAVRLFALTKLDWIKRSQRVLRLQERESPREYVNRESHHVWGRRLLLNVVEEDAPPDVTVQHSTLRLQVRPGTPTESRAEVLSAWYRQQLRLL